MVSRQMKKKRAMERFAEPPTMTAPRGAGIFGANVERKTSRAGLNRTVQRG
jgi:hypothetical protein